MTSRNLENDLPDGEILYNGIELPYPWPLEYGSVPYEPMPVPYLDNPPNVVPIDVGRQLFVDDFLIETTDMTRTYHQATYYSGNPVIAPETAAEIDEEGNWIAGPFSGGAFYDPEDSLFKLWYRGGSTGEYGGNAQCFATSRDGKNWDRPNLDVNPVGLLHHFTCTPSNPSAGNAVTIEAYDEFNQQIDLGDYDVLEFCFFAGVGCVYTGGGGITIDVDGGAVFTVTQAMLDDGTSFDFLAYKASAPPETELFKLPFPFDTITRAGNVVYPFSEEDNYGRDGKIQMVRHRVPGRGRLADIPHQCRRHSLVLATKYR
jgi:hypothetical protein